MEATLVIRTETTTEALAVIEDDPDVQFLNEIIFSMDPRFTLANMAETAEEALLSARTAEPGIIVLDHGLAGPLTGMR
jgi:response regulator of citrate/malate metabolism